MYPRTGRRALWSAAWSGLLSLLAVSCSPPPDTTASKATSPADSEKDRQSLIGRWVLVEAMDNGRTESREELQKVTWTFDGNGYTLTYKGDVRQGAYQLSPAKDPKEINVTVLAGADAGNSYQGIYKFADNNFILCWPTNAQSGRPKEFTGRAGSGQILMVLRRS